MNNFIFSTFLASYLLIVLFLTGLIAPAFGQSTGNISLSDKKVHLTRKIDSLDLEKQTQKRLGTSIDELELQQAELRDSLRIIRKTIQNKNINPEIAFKTNSASKLLKPQNLFDWMVLIVGGIATLSGIVLLWGILKILFSPPRKTAQNSRISLNKASVPEEHTDKPDFATPVLDPEIGKLRERLNYEHTPNATSTAPVFQFPELPQLSVPTPINQHNSKTVSEQTIIAAAQNGMDIPEISRHYQISTDHVTLILKIAGIKFLKP
jgi:hypothetical protein